MIQPQELMIGNWVLPANSDKPERIERLTLEAINTWGCYLYQPIRLTRELLLKCHAVYKPSGYFIGKLKFSVSGSQLVYFNYSGKSVCITHLHTLQNLVSVLTGSQLKIDDLVI